jgi:hypothetical protein
MGGGGLQKGVWHEYERLYMQVHFYAEANVNCFLLWGYVVHVNEQSSVNICLCFVLH